MSGTNGDAGGIELKSLTLNTERASAPSRQMSKAGKRSSCKSV